MLTHRVVALLACTWTLSSCMPRPSEAPVPAGAPEAVQIEVPAGTEALQIDPGPSVVSILVRRAGVLASLGHNHVVVSARETGVAWIGRELADSGFELRLPVTSFVVDDPAARAAAGPDFAGVVPENARQGTYTNMLRDEVLDAGHHPEIVVRATRVSGTWVKPQVMARVTLRGATREVAVPLELRRDPAVVAASGVLRIRQTDFGITPFSVGGGAIQVADELEIRFAIVASRR